MRKKKFKQFTKQPKTPEITSKNIAFFEGDKLLAGDLCANLDKTNAVMVQLARRWKWKWIF